MSRRATLKDGAVKKPLLALSARAQMVPSVAGGSFDPPKNLTAASPVTIPVFCGSAREKRWAKAGRSRGESAGGASDRDGRDGCGQGQDRGAGAG